jgi:hypothetical protein
VPGQMWRWLGALGGAVHKDRAAATTLVACKDREKIEHQAAELTKNEFDMMFKKANLDLWYQSSTDGIRQKMPQIIPALWFIDNSHLTSWARSPFELMQMSLLVLMGMLGGIIKVTDWLIKPPALPSQQRPSWSEYFYRPLLGGGLAFVGFLLFEATKLIIVGPTPESTTTVAASVFLLAALGLVSGFRADKVLELIEKAAMSMFSTRDAASVISKPMSGTESEARDTGANVHQLPRQEHADSVAVSATR